MVADGARLTVLDLSGFRTPHEPLAVSLDLVERLWARRGEPDAHARSWWTRRTTSARRSPPARCRWRWSSGFIQIAAEGRKYGLWLLLSTQRPSKIHPQVLSQCDNLVLMRMNSPGDIAELAEVFGFAPPAMLRSSRFFAQGEALVAGGFVPAPSIIRMGARLTYEGGSDVAVPVPESPRLLVGGPPDVGVVEAARRRGRAQRRLDDGGHGPRTPACRAEPEGSGVVTDEGSHGSTLRTGRRHHIGRRDHSRHREVSPRSYPVRVTGGACAHSR